MTAPPLPPPGERREARPELEDAAPLLGSWRNLYLLVLSTLAVLVLLFWALTRAYA